MPAGRPSKYKPEFAEQARKLCELGATDAELADFFGVNTTTIWRWQSAHDEFCNALKVGKAPADEKVERSLYQRACGYTFDSEKIMSIGGKVVRVKTREHVPPDTASAIFWLKNRRQEEWRDVSERKNTGTIEHKHTVADDVADFTSRISGLAARRGTGKGAGKPH